MITSKQNKCRVRAEKNGCRDQMLHPSPRVQNPLLVDFAGITYHLWNRTNTVDFAWRLEIFQGRWLTRWISQGRVESFQGFGPFSQWCGSGFRTKQPLCFVFSHHFQMFPLINVLLLLLATPTFANKEKLKFIFHEV